MLSKSEELPLVTNSENEEVYYSQYLSHKEKQSKPIKKQIIIIGDSLSDRGEMDKRELLGFIDMSDLSGLSGTSPQGRFTNGFTWSDFFATSLATEFKVAKIKEYCKKEDLPFLGADDFSDQIIAGDQKIKLILGDDLEYHRDGNGMRKTESDSAIQNGIIIDGFDDQPGKQDYDLDEYNTITYHGKPWIRSYCQGGLTSWNYKHTFTDNIVRFFSRTILVNLDIMRNRLLTDDRKIARTYQDKRDTLILEWSGANDFITVNEKPTIKAADKIISARINNVEKLIHAGYQDFVLFNLPDLSLTPRFQEQNQEERQSASACCDYLNEKLLNAATNLQHKYPSANIKVFDINTIFKSIYHNPLKYGFDPDKLTTPFTTSPDFFESNGLSPAKGYFFWDDVHPTADTHAVNASKFYDWLLQFFNFEEPDSLTKKLMQETEDQIVTRYREIYDYEITEKMNEPFGCVGNSSFDYQNATLSDIINHGLNGGKRTKRILIRLGVFDQNGEPDMEIPAVRDAFQEITISTCFL